MGPHPLYVEVFFPFQILCRSVEIRLYVIAVAQVFPNNAVSPGGFAGAGGGVGGFPGRRGTPGHAERHAVTQATLLTGYLNRHAFKLMSDTLRPWIDDHQRKALKEIKTRDDVRVPEILAPFFPKILTLPIPEINSWRLPATSKDERRYARTVPVRPRSRFQNGAENPRKL